MDWTKIEQHIVSLYHVLRIQQPQKPEMFLTQFLKEKVLRRIIKTFTNEHSHTAVRTFFSQGRQKIAYFRAFVPLSLKIALGCQKVFLSILLYLFDSFTWRLSFSAPLLLKSAAILIPILNRYFHYTAAHIFARGFLIHSIFGE